MVSIASYTTGDLPQRSWTYSPPPAIKITETKRTQNHIDIKITTFVRLYRKQMTDASVCDDNYQVLLARTQQAPPDGLQASVHSEDRTGAACDRSSTLPSSTPPVPSAAGLPTQHRGSVQPFCSSVDGNAHADKRRNESLSSRQAIIAAVA